MNIAVVPLHKRQFADFGFSFLSRGHVLRYEKAKAAVGIKENTQVRELARTHSTGTETRTKPCHTRSSPPDDLIKARPGAHNIIPLCLCVFPPDLIELYFSF